MSRTDRPRWLPVLLYHRVAPRPDHDPWGNFVGPRAFESHLRWLRAWGYRSVTLSAVADSLEGGRPLPRRAVAITFDDGYLDTYEYAFPLLQRYGFGAAVFLVSDAVGGDSSFDAGSGYEPAPMLGWDQIQEMASAGVEFGSHTCSHPDSLSELDDDRLRVELESSRRAIEALLDAPADLFSYPHSRLDGRVEAAVAAAGYRLACAGVGTRFEPRCVCRVAPPQARGPAVDVVAGWRRLKWRARSVLASGPRRTA
jgi:peptidoglycan/xylan/chitin deacetylase (PgdA/CDA1 family)